MEQEITAKDSNGHVVKKNLFIQQAIYQQPTIYQALLQELRAMNKMDKDLYLY